MIYGGVTKENTRRQIYSSRATNFVLYILSYMLQVLYINFFKNFTLNSLHTLYTIYILILEIVQAHILLPFLSTEIGHASGDVSVREREPTSGDNWCCVLKMVKTWCCQKLKFLNINSDPES